MEFHGRFGDVKIVQFSTTEKLALDWANTYVYQTNASTEHNIRILLAKLQGPHKLLPFHFEWRRRGMLVTLV